MVYIKPGSSPKGVYKKPHSENFDPYKILKKISSNAYVIDFPKYMSISKIFNVLLPSYKGGDPTVSHNSIPFSFPDTKYQG